MNINIVFYILLFITGACLGSFANACAYRLKENMSIAFGRSQCPKCKKSLGALELFPIFSFIFQKGKCKGCKKPISPHYLIFEVVFGVFTAFLGSNLLVEEAKIIQFVLLIMIGLFIFIIVVSDFLYLEIPDSMNVLITLFTVVYVIAYGENKIISLVGAVFAALFFFTIFKYTGEHKMGFGDVKMVFGVGLLFGFFNFIYIVIFSSLFGIIYGLLFSWVTNTHYRKVKVPLGSMIGLVSMILIIIMTTSGQGVLDGFNNFNMFF